MPRYLSSEIAKPPGLIATTGTTVIASQSANQRECQSRGYGIDKKTQHCTSFDSGGISPARIRIPNPDARRRPRPACSLRDRRPVEALPGRRGPTAPTWRTVETTNTPALRSVISSRGTNSQ